MGTVTGTLAVRVQRGRQWRVFGQDHGLIGADRILEDRSAAQMASGVWVQKVARFIPPPSMAPR
jgi:hypothetical protein